MLSLSERLRQRIQREGPISFCSWMNAALYDETEGYYCRAGQRWGRAGDYRTSPERSVLFAATFARYFVKLYREVDSPPEWFLVELGAGAGDFAENVLDTLQLRAPDVFAVTKYVIDESSPDSQSRARDRLARFGAQVQFAQLETLGAVPVGVVFSNELLDAFPVHRVTLQQGRLLEFFVDATSAGTFEWKLLEPATGRLEQYLAANDVQLIEGQIAEVNLEMESWLQRASRKLKSGHLVTVDYGAEANELYSPAAHPSGTLRGFKQHQITGDVLSNPGEQDMTSSVNWTQVMRIGEQLGLENVEFARQDQFLLREGLLEELEQRVADSRDEAERLALRTSVREMILPHGMAASFQVLVQRKKP
jgi:SAM-dependent MidA family methyltransferase